MDINDIILTLQQKHKDYGITLYPAASLGQIAYFEHTYKIILPDDIKTFYRFCDGFESAEDLFRIIPLDEIGSRMETDFFYIAEYLIYCDMWGLKINPSDRNDYIIFVGTDKCRELKLTNSFTEFLERFLSGGVFEKGGLYDWHEEIWKNRDIDRPNF
jgi:cell wall assembly regulator SMI1